MRCVPVSATRMLPSPAIAMPARPPERAWRGVHDVRRRPAPAARRREVRRQLLDAVVPRVRDVDVPRRVNGDIRRLVELTRLAARAASVPPTATRARSNFCTREVRCRRRRCRRLRPASRPTGSCISPGPRAQPPYDVPALEVGCRPDVRLAAGGCVAHRRHVDRLELQRHEEAALDAAAREDVTMEPEAPPAVPRTLFFRSSPRNRRCPAPRLSLSPTPR